MLLICEKGNFGCRFCGGLGLIGNEVNKVNQRRSQLVLERVIVGRRV